MRPARARDPTQHFFPSSRRRYSFSVDALPAPYHADLLYTQCLEFSLVGDDVLCSFQLILRKVLLRLCVCRSCSSQGRGRVIDQ